MYSRWGVGEEEVMELPWTRLQDKLFEQALVLFPTDTPDRWENIASRVPGKTPLEVRQHYEDLVHDVLEIDSGRVELPSYVDEDSNWAQAYESSSSGQVSLGSSKRKVGEAERKKGVPWTEEEHRLFLIGLQRYGKGDWRSISRNAVVSRTPTQVASHAQKYYLRLNSAKKEKKRSSIHDIGSVDNTNSMSMANQTWVGPSSSGLNQSVLDPTAQSALFLDPGFCSLGYQQFGPQFL
ncbi:SANT/Myb domain [Dillenia turbinata]|uniref:SANT/Myb domain n=1 Tax=Dillenia turbinata TaxID=194707 RepID=A0AAN8VJJ7_9MAGN